MIRRHVRELEQGDEVHLFGRPFQITDVSVEHRIVRITFANGSQVRLPIWEKVWCRT